jgi:prevent-host-death family protein
MQVNVHEAKTSLSKLLALVENGTEVVIARHGKPVAQLVKVRPTGKPVLGSAAGRIKFHKGWNAPMSEAELEEFIGR